MMASRNNTGSASALPFALIAQAVPMLSRHELADFVEALIDRLDALTPDADLEDEPDDEDNGDAEAGGGEGNERAEPFLPVYAASSRELLGWYGPPTVIGDIRLIDCAGGVS